jgi:hypothetical protein
MKSFIHVALAAFALMGSPCVFASYTLNAVQKAVVAAWLSSHPDFRIAEDKDCDCDENIRAIRSACEDCAAPVPDYHPYTVSGDLNGDRVIDFAVVVLNKRIPHDFTLLVFNGPLNPKRPLPAFIKSHMDMTRTGLFYGPPGGSRFRLLIGLFDSDGQVLQPYGKTYRLLE